MDEQDGGGLLGEEEEEEQVDPRTLKPDLYAAACQNDTAKVLELLGINVPATYIDDTSGWTVSSGAALRAADRN